jgi:transposase-like protein
MHNLSKKQLWVFGMTERGPNGGTGQTYMETVKTRDARTLLRIIYKHCRPGTIIHSDLWKAYKAIPKLDKNFVHYSVNHSLYFVEPGTKIHTNGIESLWRKAKAKLRKQNGIRRGLVEAYVNVFLWKHNAGKEPFFKMLEDIARCYPLNSDKKFW